MKLWQVLKSRPIKLFNHIPKILFMFYSYRKTMKSSYQKLKLVNQKRNQKQLHSLIVKYLMLNKFDYIFKSINMSILFILLKFDIHIY